jgi:hypothetical protein
VLFLQSSYAGASVLNFTATLDGAQAGTGSPGTGFASLSLDDVADTLSINLTYQGLTTPVNNAHIHCCAAPGVSAGVVIPFVPPFVLGATSGTFINTFNLTPIQVADVESGLSYINIHTTAFPAGEIRGQVVPEPASLGFLIAALAVLAPIVSRRRR